MCTEKNAVSLLQEIAVELHSHLPIYNIIAVNDGFKSTVTLSKLSASAVAENKKTSKRLSAENLLALMDNKKLLKNVKISKNIVEVPVTACTELQSMTSFNFNSVGKLNECCSQNYISYPTYNTVTCQNGTFITECKLLEFTTSGCGLNKKEAKKIAAKEMLSKFGNFQNFSPIASTKADMPTLLSEDIQDVVYKYQKHCNKLKLTTKDELDGLQEHACKLKYKVDESLGEDDLKVMLKSMNIKYKIFQMQQCPLILVFETEQTDTLRSFTVMHGGDNYGETNLGLLKKAVTYMKVLINYSLEIN